ncbi:MULTISPECIES: DUF1269 domain-containing protein [unclassified Nocardioides]|uniref:DUF1269 domain-containing protein n=1 Tax=unclassified Nocardioides TaxID=2615069 RepID=UPI0036160D3D
MATLTVWRFATVPDAAWASAIVERALPAASDLPHDAAIVEWSQGDRRPHIRQVPPTTTDGTLGEGFWGLLFGLIFFVPLLGAAIGATTGSIGGSLADVGIDDHFINLVRDHVTPGTSALFVLGSGAVVEQLHEVLALGPTAELITTAIDARQEAALREVFGS